MDKIDTFDEELKKLEKMNQTIYMMIVANRNKDRLAASLFQEELIGRLEEFEGIIPYRGTIEGLLQIRDNHRDRLKEKYKEESRERMNKLFCLDNKDYYIEDKEKSQYFNVVRMAADGDYYGWWYDLLDSKLSIERRSSMLIDMLSLDYGYGYDTFFSCASYHKVDDKIKEIFKYINETPNFKYGVFQRLLKQNSSVIGYLQENGYVDFAHNCGDTQIVLFYLLRDQTRLTKSFIAVYNSLTDQEKRYYISEIINYSGDSVSIVVDIARDLKFKPLKHTVDYFSNYAINNFDRINRKWGIEDYREDISNALIRKASNKKEYKEYKKYVEDFLARTDYKKHLEEKELNELEVAIGRLDLSTALYGINDKLQEEYPGKMKLKNIDFKKQS